MIITKEFEIEMAHYVPNASSNRCAHNIHGHSYRILVSLTADHLDNAGMIYDFGLMKETIGSFIDSMDHTLMLYEKTPNIENFMNWNERYIITPFIPSAEMMALYILDMVDYILSKTRMKNGENHVRVYSVQVYETRKGSATAFRKDLKDFRKAGKDFCETMYSEGVRYEWTPQLLKILMEDKTIFNPNPNKQVKIPRCKL